MLSDNASTYTIRQLERTLSQALEYADIYTNTRFNYLYQNFRNEPFKIRPNLGRNDQYEQIKNILADLGLINEQSETISPLELTITSEMLSLAISKFGSFDKLKLILDQKIEAYLTTKIPAEERIKKYSQILGVEDDPKFSSHYKTKFEGGWGPYNFHLVSTDFRFYLEKLNERDRQCFEPIVEGFERYSPREQILSEFPEGFTPIPLSYRVEGLGSHAVGLGIFRKGNAYFLEYTNTGHASSAHPGSFIFEIDPEKLKHKNIESFYTLMSGFYNQTSKGLSLPNHTMLMQGLGFFLTKEQLDLINNVTPITENMAIKKNEIYAIDSARAIYQYAQAQKTGNCSLSNNRKQKKSDIALCLISRDPQIMTYESLKEKFKDEDLQKEIHSFYKNFSQKYQRNEVLDELLNFISEVYLPPYKFGQPADELKNNLQHLIAFYLDQHQNRTKDIERIEKIKNKLKHEFSKKEYEGFSKRVDEIGKQIEKNKEKYKNDMTLMCLTLLTPPLSKKAKDLLLDFFNSTKTKDINFIYLNNSALLSGALKAQDPEISQAILSNKHFDAWQVLMDEVQYVKDPTLINLLLKQKMDINKRGEDGSLLYQAVVNELDSNIILSFLEAGALIEESTLRIAEDNPAILKILIDEQQKRTTKIQPKDRSTDLKQQKENPPQEGLSRRHSYTPDATLRLKESTSENKPEKESTTKDHTRRKTF